MKYCKHLKKRKNKPYCKLLDKEITLSEFNRINSDSKCRKYKSNNNQISNSAVKCRKYKSNNNQISNSAVKCRKMKNK